MPSARQPTDQRAPPTHPPTFTGLMHTRSLYTMPTHQPHTTGTRPKPSFRGWLLTNPPHPTPPMTRPECAVLGRRPTAAATRRRMPLGAVAGRGSTVIQPAPALPGAPLPASYAVPYGGRSFTSGSTYGGDSNRWRRSPRHGRAHTRMGGSPFRPLSSPSRGRTGKGNAGTAVVRPSVAQLAVRCSQNISVQAM
jgi:hypothetical protein